MMRGFVRDESGMVMGLTVIMVLLIGVMGAGLLTFVMKDLQAVVEVNRGQRALDIADAGVQAAKSHLRVDSFRQHYDTNGANDCDEGIRVGGENWSRATDVYTDPDGYCTGPGTRSDVASTPWREDQGVSKAFAGGRFHVTIECFVQGTETDTNSPCKGGAGYAPVASIEASNQKFFKITSTGYDTAAGNGAIRKVEAIYTTAKRTYAPIAYWTPKNIDFGGTKCVSNMSFFAGVNITNTISGQGCNKTDTPAGIIADRPASDNIYKDWYNSYNSSRRVNASNTSIKPPGFGAVGFVCGSTCKNDGSDRIADGYQDYDSTTDSKGQKKQFVAKVTDPSSQITFPFDPRNTLGENGDPRDIIDPSLVEEMRAAAAEQDTYVKLTNSQNHSIKTTDWPVPGGVAITYFVDAAGGNVSFDVNPTNGKKAAGILIVQNGNFELGSSSSGFQGVIIVIGDGTTTGKYTQAGGGSGKAQLDGYVSASGDMKISGSVSPSTTIDYTNLNSFYDVKLWSWRELYQ